MAEESQPTKRHKQSEKHTEQNIPQASPNGDELDTQMPFPHGEEENKLDNDDSVESGREKKFFLDSDIRKTLDDKLVIITATLPKFQHLHGLISCQLLSEVERIPDPRGKSQGYQYLRVTLKDAISKLHASTITLVEEMTQLRLYVSTQKDVVDTHKAKVAKQARLIKDSVAKEDADLSTEVEELRTKLASLQAEYASLEKEHSTAVTKLGVLSTRHTTLISETSLWEGTLSLVKTELNTLKRAHKKRSSAGGQSGSSEPNLSNVDEWALSNAGPRTAQQSVRDPLHAMNAFDRLSGLWASQPLGSEHPFANVIDRSTLTPPKNNEHKRVLCKAGATIIFYLLPADTTLALRYINALDFPRPATLLRVIKPKGNRAGEAQIPVVIKRLTAYIWRLLHQRVVYFTSTLAVGIRHAVNDENTEHPRHAWVERVPNHVKWLPRNYPFDIQHVILQLLDCDAILMPKRLDMSWYEAICLSTSGLDIVFKTTAELAKFMRHTHEDIPLFIAQGGVSNTTARVMGDSFTMDVPLGAYAVDFLNIPRTITAERLLEVLGDLNLQPQGFRDVTKGRGARAPIFRVGFPDKQLRHEAVLTLSGQIIPQLFRAPLRVSLARDIPRGHCFACGQKGHSARDKEKCFPTCRICHELMVVVEDGEEIEHKCLYIQEEYDPILFKQHFESRSRSQPSPTVRSRPNYFTTPQGRMPQTNQQPSPMQPLGSPPAQPSTQQWGARGPAAAPQLTFEQFQQQQLQQQQQQYQAYLQQQQQFQMPAQPQGHFQFQSQMQMTPSQRIPATTAPPALPTTTLVPPAGILPTAAALFPTTSTPTVLPSGRSSGEGSRRGSVRFWPGVEPIIAGPAPVPSTGPEHGGGGGVR